VSVSAILLIRMLLCFGMEWVCEDICSRKVCIIEITGDLYADGRVLKIGSKGKSFKVVHWIQLARYVDH
jgi:hypothetical protein